MATSLALPDLFKSLADPSRLRILHVLSRAELGVGELSQVLGLAQSGVSRHLSVLKGAGLVSDRREGSSNLFRVRETPSEERTRALWPVVGRWLDELPEAPADDARLEAVLSARRKDAQAFFERVAPHWDDIRSAQYGDELRVRALLELIPPELVVLDVGTGTGFMLEGLARCVRRAIGVDASSAMLQEARVSLEAAGLLGRVDLRRGEMEALPVADEEVDVVLANMALHHAQAPGDALAEMARVLKPGGRVVLTDLASHELDWTREELADAWPGFEPEELRRRLAEAGFDQAAVSVVGTCTLERRGSRERHLVDVLLATATKQRTGERGEAAAPRRKTLESSHPQTPPRGFTRPVPSSRLPPRRPWPPAKAHLVGNRSTDTGRRILADGVSGWELENGPPGPQRGARPQHEERG